MEPFFEEDEPDVVTEEWSTQDGRKVSFRETRPGVVEVSTDLLRQMLSDLGCKEVSSDDAAVRQERTATQSSSTPPASASPPGNPRRTSNSETSAPSLKRST